MPTDSFWELRECDFFSDEDDGTYDDVLSNESNNPCCFIEPERRRNTTGSDKLSCSCGSGMRR